MSMAATAIAMAAVVKRIRRVCMEMRTSTRATGARPISATIATVARVAVSTLFAKRDDDWQASTRDYCCGFRPIGAQKCRPWATLSIRRIAVCPIDEHCIAVAEETVPLGDRMSISAANRFHSGERRHEHQQRRLRQMKIGEQAIDDAEAESGGDEEACLAGQGLHSASIGRRLERPQRRRPDSQNTSAASTRDRDRLSCGRRNIKSFGMHSMLRKVLGFD